MVGAAGGEGTSAILAEIQVPVRSSKTTFGYLIGTQASASMVVMARPTLGSHPHSDREICPRAAAGGDKGSRGKGGVGAHHNHAGGPDLH